MNKVIKMAMFFAIISLLFTGCKAKEEETTVNPSIIPVIEDYKYKDDSTNNIDSSKIINNDFLKVNNYFEAQAEIDEVLLSEAENGYSFEEPLVIVNPYGNSPLTAVAIFTTDVETGGSVTVKGKATEDNIAGRFAPATNHVVPIYGLYPDGITEVVIALESGETTILGVAAETIELDSEGFEMKVRDKNVYDYSKLIFISGYNGYFYAVDSKGDIRWCMAYGGSQGIQPLGNGRLIVPTEFTIEPQYYKSGFVEMDLLGKVYHEYAIPGGQHHDTFIMPNGNIMVASCRQGFETVGDYIVEIDRETGEVVWELNMAQLIDSNEGSSLYRSNRDWFHNNSIWYDEDTDTLLLSGANVDAIVGVDKTEKTLKWIIGDPEGWSRKYQQYFFKPIGDDFQWQYLQSEVSLLSNGDIMCFDKGGFRTKALTPDDALTGNKVYSRAVVFRINQEDMTIEQIWQYGKEYGKTHYSQWLGGATSLEKDPNNIMMTFGSNLYNPRKRDYDYGFSDMFFQEDLIQSTKIYQVKEDKPVFDMVLNHLTYKTLRLSPYKEAGDHNVNIKGEYKGNLGETNTVDVDIDIRDARTDKIINLNLDPTKLTLDISYERKPGEDMLENYIVLHKDDGSLYAYKMNQIPSEDKPLVYSNVRGWVAIEGLEGATYDIFVVLGGTVYNSGYKIKL